MTFSSLKSILAGPSAFEEAGIQHSSVSHWTGDDGKDLWHRLLFQHDEDDEQETWEEANEETELIIATRDAEQDQDEPSYAHHEQLILPIVDAQPAGDIKLPFPCSVSRGGAINATSSKYESTPSFLRRSLLHAGSGEDVRRVLKRAVRLSRAWQAGLTLPKGEGDAFRVMVLGGSGK